MSTTEILTHVQDKMPANPVTGTGRRPENPVKDIARTQQCSIRRGAAFFAGGIACDSGLVYYGLRQARGIPCAGEPGDPRRIRCSDTDQRTATREVRPSPGVPPVKPPPGMLHLLPRNTVGEVREFCAANSHMQPVARRLAGIDPAARTDEGARACPALAHACFTSRWPQIRDSIAADIHHSRDPEIIARAAAHGLAVDARPGLHFVVGNGCSATAPGAIPVFLTGATNACHELGAEHDEVIALLIGPHANSAGDRAAVYGNYFSTVAQLIKGYTAPSETKIRTPAGIVTPQRPWFTRAYVVDGATTDFSFARAAVPHIIAEFLLAHLDQPQGRAALESWFVDGDGDVDLVGSALGPRVWGRFGIHVYRVDPEYAARRLRAVLRRRVAQLFNNA